MDLNLQLDYIKGKFRTGACHQYSPWTHCVLPRDCIFTAILSLDIVYSSLNPEDIKACERKLDVITRDG